MELHEMTLRQYQAARIAESAIENGCTQAEAAECYPIAACEVYHFELLYSVANQGKRTRNVVLDHMDERKVMKLKHDFPTLYGDYMPVSVRRINEAIEANLTPVRVTLGGSCAFTNRAFDMGKPCWQEN